MAVKLCYLCLNWSLSMRIRDIKEVTKREFKRTLPTKTDRKRTGQT